MTRPILRVAGCQFSTEPDLEHNRRECLSLIQQSADQGARVVHFPETALTGYAAVDLPSLENYDWPALHDATQAICDAAREYRVWVVLGSTHPLSNGHRPHNSLYIINDQGQIVERYDKRFCTGTAAPEETLDHCNYTPGNHTSLFTIDGYRCSALICYDYRFPELYRDLKRHQVEVVFHSFHNARRDYRTHHYRNIWKEIVPATIMCHAATNHMWISAVNSAAKYSSFGNFFVRPDGRLTGKLPIHQSAALLSDIDGNLELWDAPAPWRDRAMNGVLHSGETVDDPRSADRTCY